jgi:hypothetical protein
LTKSKNGGERQRGRRQLKKAAVFIGTPFMKSYKAATSAVKKEKTGLTRQQHKGCRLVRPASNIVIIVDNHADSARAFYQRRLNDACPPVPVCIRSARVTSIRETAAVGKSVFPACRSRYHSGRDKPNIPSACKSDSVRVSLNRREAVGRYNQYSVVVCCLCVFYADDSMAYLTMPEFVAVNAGFL